MTLASASPASAPAVYSPYPCSLRTGPQLGPRFRPLRLVRRLPFRPVLFRGNLGARQSSDNPKQQQPVGRGRFRVGWRDAIHRSCNPHGRDGADRCKGCLAGLLAMLQQSAHRLVASRVWPNCSGCSTCRLARVRARPTRSCSPISLAGLHGASAARSELAESCHEVCFRALKSVAPTAYGSAPAAAPSVSKGRYAVRAVSFNYGRPMACPLARRSPMPLQPASPRRR